VVLAEAKLLGVAEPFIVDMTIYPPFEGKQLVTGQISLAPGRRRNYEPFELLAPIPFAVPGRETPDENFTVREYLAAKAPNLSHRYAWWANPTAQAAAWFGGSVMLIGGIWPVLLGVLIGAGFGRKRAPAEPEYDLDRFGKDEPQRMSETKRPVSDEELQRLREVEAELERNLARGSAAVSSEDPPPAEAGSPAGPVKTLAGGPLEAVAQAASDEAKDYRGEFYPVAHPVTVRPLKTEPAPTHPPASSA
jgi:hypothetical protein